MSVDTLNGKDSRLIDMVLDKAVIVKSVQTESILNQQQKVGHSDKIASDKVSLTEQVVKSVTEPSEKSESIITFDSNQIRQTLEQINKLIPIANTRLVFEFDELGDPPIIKVIDKTSNELIREIPSQDLVKVAKAFSEMADNLNKAGALVNFQA